MSKHLAEQLARTTAVAALPLRQREALRVIATAARVHPAGRNGTESPTAGSLATWSGSPYVVAAELKTGKSSAYRAVAELVAGGFLIRAGRGAYAVPTPTDWGATVPQPQDVSEVPESPTAGTNVPPPRHLTSPPRVSTPTTNVVVAPADIDSANQPVLNGTVAQQLVADYADACTELGVVVGPRSKGRVGKEAIRLLHDGHGYEHLRTAVRDLARRNASPSTLEFIVGDVERVANGVPMGRARPASISENPVDARLRAIREGRA